MQIEWKTKFLQDKNFNTYGMAKLKSAAVQVVWKDLAFAPSKLLSWGNNSEEEKRCVIFVEKPDHIIVHKVERCQNCQQSLKAVAAQDYDNRQVFDVPPLRLEITEHPGERKECPHGHQITAAAFPEGVTHATQ